MKAKAIIIGLSLVWPGLVWPGLGAVPGLVWHCMPKFWGRKTAKHANTHRQQRCRHQARGICRTAHSTMRAHGHRDTGKVRSLSFNSLAALTFCRVCTSQQGNPNGNTATITTKQENKKTTLWLPANSPKCHALSPSTRHSTCHCISLFLSLSPTLSLILPEFASPCPAQSACMFDELIKARARLNFKSIPFPV